MWSRRRKPSTLLAALVLCACDPLQIPAGALISCGPGSPCPEGYLCKETSGRCAPVNSNTTPPALTAQPPVPGVGTVGTRFTVVFDVTKELVQAPTVTAQMLTRAQPLSRDDAVSSALHHVFHYVADGGEPEGVVKVYADLVDTDFNAARGLPLGSFGLDFQPPVVAIASVGYLPDPTNPLGLVSEAKAGTTVVVTVIANEPLQPLDAGAAPTLFASTGTGARLDFVLSGSTASGVTFKAQVRSTDPDGFYLPSLAWSDLAGNRATGAAFSDPLILVRTTTPSLLVDQTAVTYLRSPWGNSASETLGDGGFRLPAGPYFALAPADPLSPAPWLPPSAFTLGGAALAKVRVWADADAGFLLGQAAPTDDGWPRLKLANLDGPQIFVTGLDRAGNESPTVALTHSEWIATPNPPPFGQPPHRLELTGQATPYLIPQPLNWSTAPAGGEGANASGVLARAEVSWRRANPSAIRPAERSGHGFAYDSARGRLVLFGGSNTALLQDTWEWDGTNWVDRTPAGPKPTARAGQAMEYDAARGRVVLFGGFDAPNFLQDTWEWDGTSWTNKTRAGPKPSVRYIPAMTYDSRRGRLVLFGGSDPAFKDDLWEYDGESWLQRLPSGPRPPARENAAMAYDPVRKRAVLYGGVNSGGVLPDLWEWDGTAWEARTPAGLKPGPRRGHSLTWDPTRKKVVFFGGSDGTVRKQDTWEWDGVAWQERALTGVRPGPRAAHRVAYDPARARLVLTGGYNGVLDLSDLWEWDGTRWEDQTPATLSQPSIRGYHAMAYDSARRRLVSFGGYDSLDAGGLNDVWEWDGINWRDALTDGGLRPKGREDPAAAYDSARGKVMVFGGLANGVLQQDLWEWDGVGWTEKTPLDAGARPAPRRGHGMVYDTARNRLVVFGGYDGAFPRRDVWEWDGAGWQDKTPAVSPPARTFHAMGYDSARSRVVVYGGSQLTFLQDVWEWDGAVWVERTPSGLKPSARVYPVMTYDAARGRMVLYGGYDGAIGPLPDPNGRRDDLWEWDGASWTEKKVLGFRPGPRLNHAMAYDSARDRVIIFAGGDGVFQQDVWELRSSPGRQSAIQLTASALGAGITAGAIEGLRVRAHCGGTFAPFGPADRGAALLGWAGGAWRTLATNRAGVDGGPGLLPAPNAALIDWTASSPTEARELFLERDRQLAFQCRPDGGSGPGAGEASVALDYLEVRLRYQLP